MTRAEQLFAILALVDDDLIDEAARPLPAAKPRTPWLRWAALAACLVLAFGVWHIAAPKSASSAPEGMPPGSAAPGDMPPADNENRDYGMVGGDPGAASGEEPQEPYAAMLTQLVSPLDGSVYTLTVENGSLVLTHNGVKKELHCDLVVTDSITVTMVLDDPLTAEHPPEWEHFLTIHITDTADTLLIVELNEDGSFAD